MSKQEVQKILWYDTAMDHLDIIHQAINEAKGKEEIDNALNLLRKVSNQITGLYVTAKHIEEIGYKKIRNNFDVSYKREIWQD